MKNGGGETAVVGSSNGSDSAQSKSDEGTGVPAALTAGDRDSFAYPTIKDRVPIIICKVIDLLHRQRLQLALKDNNALKQVLELMVSFCEMDAQMTQLKINLISI